ncbi:hypothetical protein PHLGIDRAFT_372682 [Phlebiopsis gigantea 11061_1 CR5-6]|uniref:C2H2-type domain-containing protein n=1 Tax=Phlebiopsis gigantea (strain 11061_1 CR5-6) TaxID=745531 RepID=A0A0C3PNZ7_PHLG1|nr:hypothetical protein PHLGIDRAFT_372682 [Phlebiopsis gigantea 11061_1 CR5-6]
MEAGRARGGRSRQCSPQLRCARVFEAYRQYQVRRCRRVNSRCVPPQKAVLPPTLRRFLLALGATTLVMPSRPAVSKNKVRTGYGSGTHAEVDPSPLCWSSTGHTSASTHLPLRPLCYVHHAHRHFPVPRTSLLPRRSTVGLDNSCVRWSCILIQNFACVAPTDAPPMTTHTPTQPITLPRIRDVFPEHFPEPSATAAFTCENASPSSRESTPPHTSSTRPVNRYACNVCTRAFRRPSSLRAHMITHTGEKPYPCTVSGCDKRFTTKSNLKRHCSIHGYGNGELTSSRSADST